MLASAGPDEQGTWTDGRVGLGHGRLRIPGSPAVKEPANLDGQVWIVADARLDARPELVAKLRGAGRKADAGTPDAELLLHAYHAWGEACVEHLLGDFAFAIWDGRRHALFCARDHFGVVPFFYASIDAGLLVSNVLECVRSHPAITDRLNDEAIGDYLLFSVNHERRTTVFADIERLPPAHTMSWSDGKVRLRRYWELPAPAPIHRNGRDVPGEYREVLRRAVEDRLAAGPIAIPLSGGLDSTMIAALACACADVRGDITITGHTVGFTQLIPDDEASHAALAAQALGIPLRTYDADRILREREGPAAWIAPPEPRFTLYRPPTREIMERVAGEGGRVMLPGHGGDSALGAGPPRWVAALPRVVRRLSRRVRGIPPRDVDIVMECSWLDHDFAHRHGLADRWRVVTERGARMSGRQAMAEHPYWEALLSSSHAEFTGLPLSYRHPFFDVRLIQFLQTVTPSRTWLKGKRIVREAMRGTLPESILVRRKSPLRGPFLQVHAGQARDPWFEELARTPELARYVRPGALLEAIRASSTLSLGAWRLAVLRPLGLATWLRERARSPRLGPHGGDSTNYPVTGERHERFQ